MSADPGSEPVYCSTGIQVLGSQALEAEGWQRRTVSDPDRVQELSELYASLGFETTTTGLDPSSFGEACTSCAVSACPVYVALFTRKKAAPSGSTLTSGDEIPSAEQEEQ